MNGIRCGRPILEMTVNRGQPRIFDVESVVNCNMEDIPVQQCSNVIVDFDITRWDFYRVLTHDVLKISDPEYRRDQLLQQFRQDCMRAGGHVVKTDVNNMNKSVPNKNIAISTGIFSEEPSADVTTLTAGRSAEDST